MGEVLQRNVYRTTAAGRHVLVSTWQLAKFLERPSREYDTVEDAAANGTSRRPAVQTRP